MKIRTITLGIPGNPTINGIRWAGEQLERATDYFSSLGYSVQTRRIALRHWDSGLGLVPVTKREELLRTIDSVSAESNINFCSVGMIREPSQIEHVANILVNTARLCASVDAGSLQRGIDRGAINAAVAAIYYLASNTEAGLGNFRFGAGFCLSPGGPFFPGSYHAGDQPVFVIGLENSDLLVKAFTISKSLEMVREILFKILLEQFKLIEEAAIKLSESIDVRFGGLDTSIAPSLLPEDSIVRAFRAVNIEFGSPGTLAACGAVTDVVKSLPVKQVGYCGIMLPVLEDAGLAQAAEEGRYRITDLIAYSSVCGVGVDTIPISGSAQSHQLKNLMLDVGTMAIKLNKPLFARVLPIVGKSPGEKTQFDSPFLCNSQVMTL